MRRWSATPAAIVVLLVLLLTCGNLAVRAQQPPPLMPPASNAFGEAKPSIFIFDDENGEQQQKVLGFTYEDLERLYWQKSDRAAGERQPPYRLDSIAAHGFIDGSFARLTVRFTVSVADTQWVTLPLRLNGCLLSDKEVYEGPGDHALRFDEVTQQYIAQFKGASDRPHVLSLRVIVPLTSESGQTRLALSTPRAPTSELVLRVPLPQAVAQASPGSVLEAPLRGAEFTDFKVLGLSSEFWIGWRSADQPAAGIPTVFECEGLIAATLDGRSVNQEAALTVRSFGTKFDALRFRLPAGATLVSGDHAGYTVRIAGEAVSDGRERRGEIVEVRLEEKVEGPVTVRLATQQAQFGASQEQPIELGGFELLGAVRQWGHLAVRVVGDWQLAWGVRRRVRQVEVLPDELYDVDNVAGFEYFGQPYALEARLAPRETRVHVVPEYVVSVGRRRAELIGRLRYQVSGAKVFSLDIDLAGWTLVEIGPPTAVDQGRVAISEDSALSIPLIQPLAGSVDIELRAERAIEDDADRIELALPRPASNTPALATLVVTAEDNVELAPIAAELSGLALLAEPPTGDLPLREQPALAYRTDDEEPRFVATFRVLERTLQVEMDTLLAIEDQSTRVEERLTYRIGREPATWLALDVPNEILASGDLQVRLGETSLVLTAPQTADDSATAARVHAMLPAATIGTCELVAAYTRPIEAPTVGASALWRAPLVTPAEGDLLRNDLTVTYGPRLKVYPPQSEWTLSTATDETPTGLMRLSATGRRDAVSFGVRLSDAADGASVRLERVWLQTMLWPDSRQERAVFRVVTSATQLRFKPPVRAEAFTVRIDGQLAEFSNDAATGDLLVPLASTASSAPTHVVELRYDFPGGWDRSGVVGLEPIKLDADDGTSWTYWQVVLPPDLHMLASDASHSHEFRWEYGNFHWRRRPALNQTQLELWVGAIPDRPAPISSNVYLFGGMGSPSRLSVRTARWPGMVLIGSGAILLAALMVMYVPLVRRPIALFALGIAAGTAAIWFPEQAVLIAQAGALGLVLALLAGTLERVAGRRGRKSVVVRSRMTRAGDSSLQRERPVSGPSYPPSTMSAQAAAPAPNEARS